MQLYLKTDRLGFFFLGCFQQTFLVFCSKVFLSIMLCFSFCLLSEYGILACLMKATITCLSFQSCSAQTASLSGCFSPLSLSICFSFPIQFRVIPLLVLSVHNGFCLWEYIFVMSLAYPIHPSPRTTIVTSLQWQQCE